MAPYYKIITAVSSVLQQDQELLEKMEKTNADELKRLDERLADAERAEGESEISDALKARANYLTRIGDKVGCILFFIPVFAYHFIHRNDHLKPRNSHWRKRLALVPGSISFSPWSALVCSSAIQKS
jgi:hypothetical protein